MKLSSAGLPEDVPQLNVKVPPFFDWKPRDGMETTKPPTDRFREILNEVETDLLQIYKYQHSKTNIAIQQVYDAFGSNIYEEAAQQSFGDFKHRRKSHAKDPETSRTKLSTLMEDFFNVSVPALQAFVVKEFNSSLILKYFSGLINVMTVSSQKRIDVKQTWLNHRRTQRQMSC